MSDDRIRCRNCGKLWPNDSHLCMPGCNALLPGSNPYRPTPNRTINVPRAKRGPGGGQVIMLIGVSLVLLLAGLFTRFSMLIPIGALVALVWGGIVFFRWLSSRRKNKQVKRVFKSRPATDGDQTFTVEVGNGATVFRLRPTEEAEELHGGEPKELNWITICTVSVIVLGLALCGWFGWLIKSPGLSIAHITCATITMRQAFLAIETSGRLARPTAIFKVVMSLAVWLIVYGVTLRVLGGP